MTVTLTSLPSLSLPSVVSVTDSRRPDQVFALVAQGVDPLDALAQVFLPALEGAVARLEKSARRAQVRQAYAVAHAQRSKRQRPRCGALCRSGKACQALGYWPKGAERPAARCRMHGGLSTGPRTDEGRARIGEAMRVRWAAWRAGEGPRPGAKPLPPEPPPASSPRGALLAFPFEASSLGNAAE